MFRFITKNTTTTIELKNFHSYAIDTFDEKAMIIKLSHNY